AVGLFFFKQKTAYEIPLVTGVQTCALPICTPQWQIEAFRRFQIPESLIDTRGYRPLTREVKAQIFGLNAARVFGVKVGAKRNELPKDYLNRIKMSYLEEGPAPSHRFYGWVAG